MNKGERSYPAPGGRRGPGLSAAVPLGLLVFLLLSGLSFPSQALAMRSPTLPLGAHGGRGPVAQTGGSLSSIPQWTDLTANYPNPPAKRAYGDMAYDAALGYDVLFGGENGAAVDGDTWNFTVAHGWHEISSSSSIPARADAGIAYDSTSSEVVLFGGCEGLTPCPAGDTWAFSGGSWTQDTTGTAPTAMLSATLSDDPGDGGVLMFGGCSSFTVLSSTCNTYVSSTYLFKAAGGWAPVSSTQVPSARDSSSLAYDPVDGYGVMFGGYTGSQTLGDTWTFQGGQWTNITPTLTQSPPPRSAGAMFWDASAQEVILYGGTGTSADLGDTWAFRGGTWTQLSASGGPSARDGMMWGAPTSSGLSLLFGGESGGAFLADTWGLGIPLTAAASASPAAVDVGQPVSFTSLASGGTGPYSYAWDFGDGATSAVENASHAYTTAQASPYSASVTVTDSAGATVSKTLPVSVTALPLVSAAASPASALEKETISFYANVSGGAAPLNYTWTMGDATTLYAQDPTHAYSGQGNYVARVVVTDATGVTALASVNVTVHAPPGALNVTFLASPTTGPVPLTVLFTPTVGGGTAPYTYLWTFGDGGASSRAIDPSHTYNTSNSFTATVNVSDSAGHTNTFTQAITVTAPPLSVRVDAVPAQGTVPLTVDFQSQVTGGQSPYTYLWTFEPGAGTSGTASPTHTFNNSGSYIVSLRVTDAPSDGRSASSTVDVNVSTNTTTPHPLTVTVQPPGCVVAGTPTLLVASLTGGTPPETLVWDFGDGSSPLRTNATSVNHTYARAGTYALNVTVTDADSRTASTSPAVNVLSSTGCTASQGSPPASAMGARDWLFWLGPEALLAAVTVAALVGFRGGKDWDAPSS